MKTTDLLGRWQLIEIEILPVEPGADDGGMHDMGEGHSMEPEGGPWATAFVEFHKDGSVKSDFLGAETGTWSLGGQSLSIELNEAELALVGEHLERKGFDEEHGRQMSFRYAKEAPVVQGKPKKLTAKAKKKIQRMWNVYCDCDHIGEDEVRQVLEDGGAAAAEWVENEDNEIHLLGAALSNSYWTLAAFMLDAGVRPTEETLELLDHHEKYGDDGEGKEALFKRLRSFA